MIKGQVQKDNRGLLAVRYYNRYNSYYHTERRLLSHREKVIITQREGYYGYCHR
jgi:hypothetical protein